MPNPYDNILSFFIIFGSNDDLFASLDDQHSFGWTFGTLKSQSNLLSGFSFLPENRFGLSTISCLFSIISSFSLSSSGVFALFVLSYFVVGVFYAFLAMSLSSLRNHHHFSYNLRFPM